MKPRCDSVLFKLNSEQQARLYQWVFTIGYQKAKDRAALPPPEGFGLRTHLNSLRRFVVRYTERQQEKQFFELLRRSSDGADPKILGLTETFAHELAFELASSPGRDLATFRQVTRWLAQIKDEKLKNSALELAAARLKMTLKK